MTEQPKAGFLCTGKTPLELSVSIHCANKMMSLLRDAGFAVGGCYTEILGGDCADKIERAGKTLEYLCRANELVLTLGCEGFAPGDVIPDITDLVCTGKASYFVNVLCGAEPVRVPKSAIDTSSEHRDGAGSPQRLYPEEGALFSAAPRQKAGQADPDSSDGCRSTLSERLNRALDNLSACRTAPSDHARSRVTYGSVMRIFAGSRDKLFPSERRPGTDERKNGERFFDKSNFAHNAVAHEASADAGQTALHVPPSRAGAGILSHALLLNFSNDVRTALPLLSALMPAIHFSVYNLSGKSAAASADFEKKLKKSSNIEQFVDNRHVVNK